MKKIACAIGVAALIAGAALLPAAAANAAAGDCVSGHFCAWDGGSYNSTMLIDTTYTGTSKIEVGDDLTSSGYNHRGSGSNYCGYSVGFLGADNYIYGWPYGTAASLTGSSNNAIDHFYYRSSC